MIPECLRVYQRGQKGRVFYFFSPELQKVNKKLESFSGNSRKTLKYDISENADVSRPKALMNVILICNSSQTVELLVIILLN